jgi:hypothetical protein
MLATAAIEAALGHLKKDTGHPKRNFEIFQDLKMAKATFQWPLLWPFHDIMTLKQWNFPQLIQNWGTGVWTSPEPVSFFGRFHRPNSPPSWGKLGQ